MLALFIPMRAGGEDGASPLRQLEHDLHPIVAFGIMPLFAIANAGVSLQGMSLATLAAPVPLGIAVGLLAGKTIGVFGASAAAIALGAARMPEGTTWGSLLGTAVLCGIGFTMSLFIANLAFAETAPELAVSAVVGILAASLLAAVAGSLVLAATLPPRPAAATDRTSVGPTAA
jgi:Na+:H+ antiporter, NhaA family